MSTPTATPRTDNAWRRYNCAELRDPLELVKEMIALETELAAAKGECERLEFATEGHLLKTIQQQAELAAVKAECERIKVIATEQNDIAEQHRRELAAAKAECERLRKAGRDTWGELRQQIHAKETELAQLRAEVEALKQSIESGQRVLRNVRVLREALENLRDEQNGAPLCTRETEWKAAMDKADAALAATKEDSL